MRSRRVAERRIARARIDHLLETAVRLHSVDAELAERYACMALKIGKRYNVSISRGHRMLICHYCKRLIFPGSTSMVRLQPRREPHLVQTCLLCGGKYRHPLKTDTRPSRVHLGV